MEDAPATVNASSPTSLLAARVLCAGVVLLSAGSVRAQTPAPAPAPAAPAAGQPCSDDNQCPGGTICQQGVCTPVEPPIHALLFRKEGGATALIPFYFDRKGNPGYRVITPFYWHFWSPEGTAKVVFPFYWKFRNHVSQRVVTVIPPFSSTVQPDASSWAIWPFFYRSTKFGWAAPLLLSFKVENPDRGTGYGLYGGLYFWNRDEKAGSALDILVPLFVSSRSPERAFTFALPLNFYWRRGQRSNLLALPLLYHAGRPDGSTTVSLLGYRHRIGESRAGSLLWLYWYGRSTRRNYDLLIPLFLWSRHDQGGTLGSPLGYYSRDGENRRGAAAWLYWFGRKTDGRKYDVVFPAFWSFRSNESNTTVIPPVLHLRRQNYALTTVFPFYWAGRDLNRGSAWRLLFPLYFSRTGEGGRTHFWVTPLGGYRRDDERETRTLTFLVPPIIYRRDPRRELDMVLGLYWRHRDPVDGATTHLVGPFYRRQDSAGSTTTFFPFFWHFRDAATGATAHSLLPLYFRRKGPDETLTAVAGFYYRNYREGGWAGGLFPVAFFGRRAERGHGVLFPLFWHFRDRRGSATVAAPFFFRFAERTKVTAGVPPLLYFYGRDRDDRYHVQFPLFWRFSNGATGNQTTVVPPVYVRTGPSGFSTGLFPLLFVANWSDRGHFVLFPLFWRFRDQKADRTSTVFLNYLYRRHGDEVTHALFPLIHFRSGAKPAGKPETSFTLFPLVHYRRTSDTRIFVSPLAVAARTPHTKVGFIPPYFWYQSRQVAASGVPPLYFDITKLQGTERTRLYGPWVSVDTPTSRARVLFPLFGRYSDEKERGTWVFPSFFHRRLHGGPDAGYALDTLMPLFWYSRSPKHSTAMVGPWYRRKRPEGYATGLVPLYFYAHSGERRFLATPLFFRRENFKEGTSRLFAAFLFYRSTRPEGHTTVLFPFLWAGRTKQRSHTVVFPVAWLFRDGDNNKSTNLVGPLYWAHEGSQRTRGLMPLLWYSRDDENRTASHAFLPLFYEKHGPTQMTLLTLPFGFRKQPDRSWWYALNVYRRDSVQSSFTMVVPLWFSHYNKTTATSTRLIPPLLHFSRSRPDRGLQGWLMLFWRYRDITSTTTLGLPVFYDIHRFHQSRLTLLVPLLFRYWTAEDQTAYNLAPLLLFYRRSTPQDSTTVAFPLFWDFRSPDRRTTVFVPFFVGVRRPSYVARFVLPNIYYRTGLGPEAGTSRLFVFPFWESAVKRPGDYMWEALLGLFGFERIGRNRYLKLLFIPFELQPAPAAQTAWYGKSPPRRRQERRYGLDTRTW
jgi:hypothetical protein